MREGIQRLVALPKPPKVSKAHHFDGLVTWESNEQNEELDPGFRYRASSIWRLVTRDLTGAELSHCAGYTPDHIHRVVQFCTISQFRLWIAPRFSSYIVHLDVLERI